MGMVPNNKIKDMKSSTLPWWEREKLLTEKDKQAIERAIQSYYADIDESWAETDLGREELMRIARTKYRSEEWLAGIQ